MPLSRAGEEKVKHSARSYVASRQSLGTNVPTIATGPLPADGIAEGIGLPAKTAVFSTRAAARLENCADYDERTEESGRTVPKERTVGWSVQPHPCWPFAMPASNRQNDRFRSLSGWRVRVTGGLVAAVLSGLTAAAAIAADRPSVGQTAGYDPFEAASPSVHPATRDAFDPRDPFDPVDVRPVQFAPVAIAVDGDAQQFGRGLTKLASGEQLPGLPATSTPDQAAAGNWSPRPLGDLSINIRLPNGMLPRDYWAEHPQPPALCDTCGTNRGWPLDCYHWCPSCLCYQPLYFEEPNLERYGYGCGCYTCCGSTCVQSACSAAHFFGTVPALPYMMAANCPCKCNYALGDYRPGDCNPWRYQCCAPCSAAGGIGEGAAAYGMILMLP
jgi:hypothetical protein